MTSFHFIYRDIDKVDELMQDIADQQELAEEISTAISKPVGFGEEFDEVSVFMKITQALQMTLAARQNVISKSPVLIPPEICTNGAWY